MVAAKEGLMCPSAAVPAPRLSSVSGDKSSKALGGYPCNVHGTHHYHKRISNSTSDLPQHVHTSIMDTPEIQGREIK